MAKDADVKAGKTAEADKKPVPAPEKPLTPLASLARVVGQLEKSVAAKENRGAVRVLRQTAGLARAGKLLQPTVLTAFARESLPETSAARALLLQHLRAVPDDVVPMEVEVSAASVGPTGMEVAVDASVVPPVTVLPEVEVYASLLAIMYLTSHKKWDAARSVADWAIQFISDYNRRTLDNLAARIYFYYAWAHENLGLLAAIRPQVLALHRQACARHDAPGQEVLLNILLRSFLQAGLYGPAEKLRSKAQLPAQHSNNQLCRYLFYLGRIRAVTLAYTEAKDCLQQAARKAPQVGSPAGGFRLSVLKWLTVTRLLLGEIPERSSFRQEGRAAASAAMQPYYELTQAVRLGDLAQFGAVVTRHEAVFLADGTFNLVHRLRNSVLRAGLRRISLAYSRISLADVAVRLDLTSAADAESICAKAIRDGAIEAVLDHATATLSCKDSVDIYATTEPLSAFHARVCFCLDTHNEAVMAMRFPDDARKGAPAEAEEARRERQAAEQEIANHSMDDDEDF